MSDSVKKVAIDLTDERKTSEEKFINWLSKKVSAAQLSEFYIIYLEISDYFLNKKMLNVPFLETKDIQVLSEIQKTLKDNNIPRFNNKYKINRIDAAIRYYVMYLESDVCEKEHKVELSDSTNSTYDYENKAEIQDKTFLYSNDKEKINFSNKRYSETSNEQRQTEFANWMKKQGMAEKTIRSYVSAVGGIGNIALERNIIHENIYEITDVEVLKKAFEKLWVEPDFIEKNETGHNMFSAAWIKYINFSGATDFSLRDIRFCKTGDNQVISKEDKNLFSRLKSMSRVYDDITGHKLEWIRERLGIDIELSELEKSVKEIPWIVEVEDGVYSFSKYATPLIDFNKEAFTRVLLQRFQKGMLFDSIDIEIFRETYLDITGEKLDLTDEHLQICLSKCGVMYKERLFPAEGIINKSANEKLMDYIEKSFSEGKKVLYYNAIYTNLSEVFSDCFYLMDAMMLKPYLEYVCNPGVYCFEDEYFSKEKDVKIDPSTEVEDFLLAAGKPLSYEDIYSGLFHVSKDIIKGVINNSSNLIMNEREHYFHYGIFECSTEDEDKISSYIKQSIDADGYCIWSFVYDRIKKTMPIFIEKNVYLSSLGIRNAVARKLSRLFHFEKKVICHSGENLSMADVYRLYGKNHTPFSDDDLNSFSKEVNAGLTYFDSLSETAVRVSKNLFVSRDEIEFDTEAIDNVISTFLEKGYMLISDISFLAFPNVGYEWNEFLLESYLMCFSEKFSLVNNGRSMNNVAGAIVRRGCGYDDFANVCSDLLAKNCDFPLTKNKALDYLGKVNLLTSRRYKKIDLVVARAKQIKNRKES